jgi:hypothetical protein
MKQVLISRTEHSGSRLCETRVARRAQVPPGDLADCLLVAYQGVSQRAFRLNQFRRAEPGSELKNWKNAEHDLLPRIFYALASVPGYTAAEISVAGEDRWLPISGYGHCSEQTELGAHDAEFDDRKGTRHRSKTMRAMNAIHSATWKRARVFNIGGAQAVLGGGVRFQGRCDAQCCCSGEWFAGGTDGEGGWREHG